MSDRTIRLHRVLRATPERVYRAFLDADALAKWLPPNGFTGKVYELDARVGGRHRMSFSNLATGEQHAFGGEYLELVPNQRLRYTDEFDDANLPGRMETTVNLRAINGGTEVRIEQANLPAPIEPDDCYFGWQDSLRLLALLVEGAATA